MTGFLLGVLLFVFFLGWLVADLVSWLTGEQSFTQWIIAEGKKSRLFKQFVMIFILLSAAYLLYHFTG